MDDRTLFFGQLKAMLKRNLLIKAREKRKTASEILLPLYTLGILILMKLLIPNPNFPEVDQPKGEVKLFEHFQKIKNHTVAVVPNTTEVQEFLRHVNHLWLNSGGMQPIEFELYGSEEDLLTSYWRRPADVAPIAVRFLPPSDPLQGPLKYEVRTNPIYQQTPPTQTLFGSPAYCRAVPSREGVIDMIRRVTSSSTDGGDDPGGGGGEMPSEWSDMIPIDSGDVCPANHYYYSGFIALQTLLDYTKVWLDTDIRNFHLPRLTLEMFPKDAYTGDWVVAIRLGIPLYMVMALSQFITYLLILIVGEKENKIKEGMRIMGLRDSVFWLSWFIIYAVFVIFLSIVCCVLLFTLKVFQNTSFTLILLLVTLYSLSVIMIGFMITPFFDKSRTAGILGNFAITIFSLLYFIQVFIDPSSQSTLPFFLLSLISPSGFALAMDTALVAELRGRGIHYDTLWEGVSGEEGGGGMPFGGSLVMMAVDIVVYGVVAYWLDNVVPSDHGSKQPPWFLCKSSFWCPRKRLEKMPLTNGDSLASVHRDGAADNNDDVEQVPREMRGREAIKIHDLVKSYQHCRRPEIKAINGINLTIYEGQITAILGHNGAGKTTLFNILTGLTTASAGKVSVFGYDTSDPDDMSQIRKMTGVCPQHDILFENLTPREHLEFFAIVKGIPSDQMEFEVSKTLRDIDLAEKANCRAKRLSGGQKRKLSVGIAIIGDPKIIILDEPTAGVDPYSRRHMWSVLRSRAHGRVILLTTHFMDEADILADRKAVVSKGKLRCAGTSLFLKNKFGIGYHLTLVLDGSCREHAITRLVTTHVPKAEKARRHGRELSFILPHNAVTNFAPLFSAIEGEINNRNSRLGISSYGVSMTTLEEVYLHLERDEESEVTMDNLSKKMVRNRALSRSLSLQSKSTSYQSLQNEANNIDKEAKAASSGSSTNPASGDGSSTFPSDGLSIINESMPSSTTTQPTVTGLGFEQIQLRPSCLQTACALLRLRVRRMLRDMHKLYFMVVLPLLLAAGGLWLSKVHVNMGVDGGRMDALMLGGSTYYDLTTLAIYNNSNQNLDIFLSHLFRAGARGITLLEGDALFGRLLDIAPHLGALNVTAFHAPNDVAVTLLYNDTLLHSLPVLLNVVNNAIYSYFSSQYSILEYEPIEVSVLPFQQTTQPQGFNVGIFSSAITMGTIFILVPLSLAIDMVYDREIKAKNQLRVNGLSFISYFSTYFLVLGGLMILICAGLLLVILVLDVPALRDWAALGTLATLLLLYCPSSILFSTCLSYIFDKTDSAQSILPNITFLGCVPFIVVIVLDMLRTGDIAAFSLHCVFSLLNTMYIPYAAVYYVQRVYLMCQVSSACTELHLTDYFTNEIIVLLVAIVVHMPFWFALLVIIDIKKSGGRVRDGFKFLFPKKKSDVLHEDSNELSDIGENEDADVKMERQRVSNLIHGGATPSSTATNANSHNSASGAKSSLVTGNPVVTVHNLHKEYAQGESNCCCCCSKLGSALCCCCARHEEDELEEATAETESNLKIAVKSLSLSVDAGEVFGLLGHNGAGKTTTMRIITAEEAATRGRVQIGGENITSNLSNAFKLLGYCPQHDAQWKNITVREHLECYAAIRGVPYNHISKVVNLYMSGLQIHEHGNKLAEHCSGGTRRKLSFAMAMVGNPKVVLLDEPSTGMDPRSKRFLWDTILASFQGSRGAILTTHSMEEADALCSRVGIMVKGELRCLGSTQHLKNLYGAGYTLEVKLAGGDRTPTGERAPTVDRLAGLRAFVAELFPEAMLQESFADRVVFSVPQQSVPSLANCFSQLERAKTELDIEEYSFSQTTLEQVFLKFAQYDEINEDIS